MASTKKKFHFDIDSMSSDSDLSTDEEQKSKPKKVALKRVKPLPVDSELSEIDEEEPKVRNKPNKKELEEVKSKAAKKEIIKPKTPRAPIRKRKIQNQKEVVLKQLLCEWSGEDDCIKKILDGKKVAFLPVFI